MPKLDADVNQSSASTTTPLPRRHLRRWLRLLRWCACGLLLFLLLAGVFFVLWLRAAEKNALPVLDGDLRISGLSAPVTVRRDAHGVPHIDAASEDDLLVAQGYVTAQDRLWQMDALRRNANGELAELMGASLLPHDRMQRVLQIRNTAQRIYANLAPGDRASLDNYARGVNLYLQQHQDSLPAEFKLLFYRPQPWTGMDSVSIGLMMVQTLDTHWDVKLGRERISEKLHNAKLVADLYPVGSWRDHPPTGLTVDWTQPHPAPPDTGNPDDDDNTQASASSPQGQNMLVAFALLRSVEHGWDAPAFGSNNWVIAGSHTVSGKPLLSNDMHLGLAVPNIWFMADLRAPGFHSEGVTLPGMPYVIAGHNEHVAWGFTALYADVQDLYDEKLDGKGNFQDTDGTYKPLAVDHEVICVRGGKDVQLNVQLTAHGPLMNPLFKIKLPPFSMRWTIYDATLSMIPLGAINKAASVAEFSTALSAWAWPTLNAVYSDDQGHVGYHAIGRVPSRPAGLTGVPIKDAAHEWQSYIPFDAMPNAFDPPSGFLATANARVTTADSKFPITLEWADPYRIERIYKSLQGREQITPKDLLGLQTDIYSEVDQEVGHRFAYAIDHTPGIDNRLRKAADLLRSWDGRMTTDSVAASIVFQARHALWPLILEPKLGEDAETYRWSESNFAEEEIIMHGTNDWLPAGFKNWDALLTEAVRKGMKDGKAPADLSLWTYGSWHVVDIEHPLAQFLPIIGRVAGTGPQPLSGDTTTVKQVGRDFGPSQRFTMDWSDIDGSTENIVLGESGNPLSPYFRDQWNDYYAGTTFAFPFGPAAVAAQTKHTMRLLP